MNTQLCLKKFFSWFLFFDTANKLERLENRYQRREQVIRYRLAADNDTIKDLRVSISDLEATSRENTATIKKRAEQMSLLHHHLEQVMKDKQDYCERLVTLQMTHKKLVRFLEQQESYASPK